MLGFPFRDGTTWCEDVRLDDLADAFGTPAFVYSREHIATRYAELTGAFAAAEPLVCYSVKASSSLGILDLLRRLGSGFDVVSGGELRRVLAVGGDPQRIVFAGVGKTPDEIAAALDAGILLFNVESEAELASIDRVARSKDVVAPVALRVNPDVDPKTHRYISTGKRESKFGIDLARAARQVERLGDLPNVRLAGIHAHIGSQITTSEPYAAALDRVLPFAIDCRDRGHPVELFNMGGGFGIEYRGGEAPGLEAFGDVIAPRVKEAGFRLLMEPGRSIVGNAAVLLTRVVFVKESGEKRFVIVDAAMNDLIRPSLYQGHHRIWPVTAPVAMENAGTWDGETWPCDVVGPVCESGDFLGLDRSLPPMQEGDLLAVWSAGAYGSVMSSNYNSRPRAPEVLVDGDRRHVIRERETFEDLVRGEHVPPDA